MKYLFLPLLLLVTACSNHLVSKEQCRNANWYGRGFSDAQKGKPFAQGGSYANACRDQGVYLDLTRWQKGYGDGLKKLCPDNLALKVAGQTPAYQGPCLHQPDFVSKMKKEQKRQEEQARVKKAEQELGQIQLKLDQLNGKTDPDSRHQRQELQWQEFQLGQQLLELKQPMALEAEAVNPGLY